MARTWSARPGNCLFHDVRQRPPLSPALWAAAATGVQVGAAIVASRLVLEEVPPLTLAMLRYAIGFCCLLPFAAATLLQWRPAQTVRVSGRDLLVMGALGVGQFGLLIALLNEGLRHIGAAPAALIFSLMPLLTLMLSAWTGREQLRPILLIGVLVSIAGVAVALAPKLAMPAVAAASSWRGELAVAAAAAVGATCSVLYRPYLQRYPMLPVSAYAMLASVLVLAALASTEHWLERVGGFSTRAWSVIAFIGVSSGAGYFAWLYALKHEPPTRVTVFLALNPLTAALLGWALLGETLHASVWAAFALIATGLWLAARSAR
jgi:drug/metabolite transporter (DMT)-like permease